MADASESPYERLLARLTNVKRQPGGGAMANCPGHDDRVSSLKVDKTADGPVLIYDHGGCGTEKVLAAIGLTMADLFPSKNGRAVKGVKIVGTYDYREASGALRYQVVRFDPKGFKQRRPNGTDGWIWNLQGVEPLLYHLPELIAAPLDDWVFVPEGEKHVDALRRLDLVATCNSGGAGKFKPEHAKYFKDRRVAILPDNDETGRGHAQFVAANVAPVAAKVKIVDLPDLQPKGDVIDWLAMGGTREQLLDLVVAGAPYKQLADTDIDRTIGTHIEQKEIAISSRILADHQQNIKWCKLGWLLWDERRWALVEESHIIGLAEQTTRRIYIALANAKSRDEEYYLLDLAKTGSLAARIRGALEFVKAHVTVSVDHPYNELDIHPELINFKNGTYDVTTGELRPHNRANLITKLIPYEYHPDAKAPRFRRFISEVFPDNEPVQKYVKQYAGYSFTGYQDEKSFPYLYGPRGNNGKTRLVEIILLAAGEYGQAASETLFVVTKHAQHTTEQARLRGMRFVAVSETEQGGKFNEARIRRMTGDDTITAHFMHKDFFDFKQTHHPWFLSNYKLQISGRDDAIWSRPKLIEFLIQFVDPTPECPEPKHRKDHTLKEQLEREIEGVLAWIVEGAREWYLRKQQNLGIEEPQCVRAAVAKYRQDEDQLQHFLDECAEVRDATPNGTKTPKSRMYAASRVWCRLQGLEPWSIKMLGILLDEAGFEEHREGSERYWKEIALKPYWDGQAGAEDLRLVEAKTGPRG